MPLKPLEAHRAVCVVSELVVDVMPVIPSCMVRLSSVLTPHHPDCAAGFGSTVAVPVPTDPRDPNCNRQSNKKREYAKRFKGTACLQCPDEYATLQNTPLPISAAQCQPCPAGQLPDAQHALCGEQCLRWCWEAVLD
jgi:hypothetical protein